MTGRPTGADLIRMERLDDLELITKECYRRAALAREDVCEFIEFVMVTEDQRNVRLAPHQRLFLEFVLHHERAAVLLPPGTSKTFLLVGLTLWMLGRNPILRGAIVCATQEQAKKVLKAVAEYIERSSELRKVFPELVKDEWAPWTDTRITIQRPMGIRDPSFAAYGLDSDTITGSRLQWMVCDDLLTPENTSSREARDKLDRLFGSTVFLGRVDKRVGKMLLTNTAWHPDDLLHRAVADKPAGRGWPLLKMDIYGNVTIKDDQLRVANPIRELRRPPFDSDLIRPAYEGADECRLVAHDPDPNNEVPLWPEVFPAEIIEALRTGVHTRGEFNQLYLNMCRDDSVALCKQEYVDRSLAKARELGLTAFTTEYAGSNPMAIIIGVDLAMEQSEKHDYTCFFVFESRPDGVNAVLEVEYGRWSGPDIVRKLEEKYRRFGKPIVAVEKNNGGAYLQQFAEERLMIPVRAVMTTSAKWDPQFGVASIFNEMASGLWAFPNRKGEMPEAMRKFVAECLYYTPEKHTGDGLMASSVAREIARRFGMGTKRSASGAGKGVAAGIMSR